ncbi:hypothetical protein CYY_007569 [Polysphondylium violaceum]|uniref:Carbohydrate binding domain-containing protein n=1 Tax=Polysphondylium violaceum TaxID=133409 RepID=A0A8J4PRP9_9MYCE|nr:hypothetical protein CYY_007569 [Polysphondylium violaceum]
MLYKQFLLFAVVLAVFSCAMAADVSLVQSQQAAWEDKGSGFSIWEVTLTNDCGRTIKDITIVGEKNFNLRNGTSDIWGVDCLTGHRFHLPSYVRDHGIPAKSSVKFGYINNGYQSAEFSFCETQYM